MPRTAMEVQQEIFEQINNPDNKTYLKVQKKEVNREKYLEDVRKRCQKERLTEEETKDICTLVDKALWGFGILDDLINEDDDISDIRLIDEKTVRVKRLGKRKATEIQFNSEQEYLSYIEFITNRNNTNMSVVNAAQVFTDKDSSPSNILRFSLVSKLVNSNGKPTLLIRKIPKRKKDFKHLLDSGYLTEKQMNYLIRRWKEGHGLLICGPNGSGKTTLINAILDETDEARSAVVIQESEELFSNKHPEMIFRKIFQRKNNSNVSYELKDLGKLALMESFDIIIVGEIKGGEAADLAYATYTGSQAMTSVHSVSAADGYEKIIDYALDEKPERSRAYFAKQLKALDTVVYVQDYKAQEILETEGYDENEQKFLFHIPTELLQEGNIAYGN